MADKRHEVIDGVLFTITDHGDAGVIGTAAGFGLFEHGRNEMAARLLQSEVERAAEPARQSIRAKVKGREGGRVSAQVRSGDVGERHEAWLAAAAPIWRRSPGLSAREVARRLASDEQLMHDYPGKQGTIAKVISKKS